jgi:hypothetical protein
MFRENNPTEAESLDEESKEFGETLEFAIGDLVELTSDGRQGTIIELNDPSQPYDKQLPYNTVRVKFLEEGAVLLCQINHLKKIGGQKNEKELTN